MKRSRARWLARIAGVLLVWTVAMPSHALTLVMTGNTAMVPGGSSAEDAEPGWLVTFDFDLDEPQTLTGYDVTVAWDPTELTYIEAREQLGVPSGDFDSAPTPIGDASGMTVQLQATSDPLAGRRTLFSVVYRVDGIQLDGESDLAWDPEASVFDSAGIPLTLAPPVSGIDVIPEPSTAILLVSALAGLSLCRRRWS